MKGRIFIILNFISLTLFCQQDLLFTEFAYDKLGVNPAYAGAHDHISLMALYRNQWIGLDGAPSHFAASANLPALSQNIGFGFQLEQSSISIFDRTTIDGSFGYQIPMTKGIFHMGLSVSFRIFSADFSDPRLVPPKGFDVDEAVDQIKYSKRIFNTGFGVYYNNEKFYAGASIPRLSKSNLDFNGEEDPLNGTEIRHLYIMTGGKWRVSRYWELSPQLLVKLPENTPFKVELNLTTIFDKRFHLGLNYSSGGSAAIESLDIILGFQYSNQIFFGTAYDISLTSLNRAEAGSLELIANYRFVKKSLADIIINPRYY